MNTLRQLARLGQSIWYDNVNRGLLTGGGLRAMVEEGCLGVTSNPTIFEKAIAGSADYDGQIARLMRENPALRTGRLIQELMMTDIRMACDVMRPVYDGTAGLDGFVSIEVTPSRARLTAETLEEVEFLWKTVDRPNLMVKIPATQEGLPAVEESLARGRNINVTLIFSEERYRQVAERYLCALEHRASEGKDLAGVASVASIFVSRVDTMVDEILLGSGSPACRALAGKAAVANARMVYGAFREIFGSPRFRALADRGARVQRPLWGSTGTKNPAYSDLLYVETLVGPDTVNTVPPQTYAAILDHGRAEMTVEAEPGGTRRVLDDLASCGVDLPGVLRKLEEDGVSAFEKSYDGLAANLDRKREQMARGS
ncbi:MAG: transaldolase [Bacteroidota bacterium]